MDYIEHDGDAPKTAKTDYVLQDFSPTAGVMGCDGKHAVWYRADCINQQKAVDWLNGVPGVR